VKKENVLLTKSYQFALRIVRLHLYLRKQQVDRVLLHQLLRSGTSIGANAEEAEGAPSKKDFIYKMSISYKEVRETCYWLRLLGDAAVIEPRMASSFLKDAVELQKIITSILVTSKKQQGNSRT
jgi:four helix bundle protein